MALKNSTLPDVRDLRTAAIIGLAFYLKKMAYASR